jgi:CHAT domain-containing protein
LIIVPDGVLNYIPFEFLVTETRCGNDFKKGCFLGDQFILSYYPSVNILNFNRRVIPQTLPARGSILAVGDPIYGSDDERIAQSRLSLLSESDRRQVSEIPIRGGRIRKEAQVLGYTFERLKHSGVEVHKVSEVFGNMPGTRDVLIGFDASEGRVKSKDLTQYQYLHFAVHGILAYDVPYLKEPALVLATDPESKEDGFLTLSEIYGLKLKADLVTLSACETGLGLRIAGEGVIGLSRAFMNAGARAILVSLWKVSDESTALLMEEFYRFLAQGIDKAEALKKAKKYLRMKGYKNPYFWAPFILIGD